MARKRKTTEEFITQAIIVHGNKYDYSKTIYTTGEEKLCIICPVHGDFYQSPRNHLNGFGCRKCAAEKHSSRLSFSTEQFIQKAINIHGQNYSYSKVDYKNNHTKVIITCPIHGDFEQTPMVHLRGGKCPKCSRTKVQESITFTTQDFIAKSRNIHGDKYDYSQVEYKNKKHKVCIICPEHGEFWQEAGHHMYGCGCPKCNSSKGEIIIEKYLKSAGIKYERQYPIAIDSNINQTGKAYIDFFIPQYNLFIEYNGRQHYMPVEHFGGKLQFSRQQLRDEYVRQYCLENNIALLELKYDLDNIITTLEEYLINNSFKIVENETGCS